MDILKIAAIATIVSTLLLLFKEFFEWRLRYIKRKRQDD